MLCGSHHQVNIGEWIQRKHDKALRDAQVKQLSLGLSIKETFCNMTCQFFSLNVLLCNICILS